MCSFFSTRNSSLSLKTRKKLKSLKSKKVEFTLCRVSQDGLKKYATNNLSADGVQMFCTPLLTAAHEQIPKSFSEAGKCKQSLLPLSKIF